MSIAEKLVTVAENQEKVFEAGKQAEYDRFWDEFQENGNRKVYSYAFAYGGWDDETYNPKYAITPAGCSNMFAYNTKITDTKVPIDLTHPGGTQKYAIFIGASKLKTIRKLIVNENNSYTASNGTFFGCTSLENITFEGVIGRDIDFSACPLSVESMINVITHLAPYRDTENEFKYTVKFSDSCWDALESSEYDVSQYIAFGSTWKEACNYLAWNI